MESERVKFIWRSSAWRKLRRVHPGWWLLALGVALLPLGLDHWLRYPRTASVPPGLYLLTYEALEPGDWVVTCLPAPVAQFGHDRGYLRAGRCDGTSEVLKRVAALPGDVVRVNEAGLWINGALVPRTIRRDRDSSARPIPAIPYGLYPVRAGQLWLVSSHHPRSWDSRFYGAVPQAGVRSTARLLVASGPYAN